MRKLSTNESIGAGVGVIVVLGLLIFGNPSIKFSNNPETANTPDEFDQPPQRDIIQTEIESENIEKVTATTTTPLKTTTKIMPKEITTKEGLKYTDVVIGTGATAVAGKEVTVHYTGTFADGKKFDSSVDRGEPFQFTLGAGKVIKGWDLGVAGMKVGGKRQLTIPATLGYGANNYGPIPGNSTLLFDVELLEVGN